MGATLPPQPKEESPKASDFLKDPPKQEEPPKMEESPKDIGERNLDYFTLALESLLS